MDVVSDGEKAIRNWIQAKQRVVKCQHETQRAESDFRDTERALIVWMLPPDAKPGEKIAIWFVDALIQVEVGGVSQGEPADGVGPAPTETRVTIRSRGRKFEEIAFR